MHHIVRYNMSNNSDYEIETNMDEWAAKGYSTVGTAISRDSLGNEVFIVTYK